MRAMSVFLLLAFSRMSVFDCLCRLLCPSDKYYSRQVVFVFSMCHLFNAIRCSLLLLLIRLIGSHTVNANKNEFSPFFSCHSTQKGGRIYFYVCLKRKLFQMVWRFFFSLYTFVHTLFHNKQPFCLSLSLSLTCAIFIYVIHFFFSVASQVCFLLLV